MNVRLFLVGKRLARHILSRSSNPVVSQAARDSLAADVGRSRRSLIKSGGPVGYFIENSGISLRPGVDGLKEAYVALVNGETRNFFSPPYCINDPYANPRAIWKFISRRYAAELMTVEGVTVVLSASRRQGIGRREILLLTAIVAPALLGPEVEFLTSKMEGFVGRGHSVGPVPVHGRFEFEALSAEREFIRTLKGGKENGS